MKKHFFTIIWLLFTAAMAMTLYSTSDKVYNTNKRIKELQSKINEEKHNIAVLEAEVATVTSPDNLEKLSREHLPDLHPITTAQLNSYNYYMQYKENIEKEAIKEKVKKKTVSEDKKSPKIKQPVKNINKKPQNNNKKDKVKKVTNIADLIEETIKEN